MVNDWIRKQWLFLPLLMSLAFPAHAAQLRDIRTGEYDGFTRIVFEFNVPAEIESIGKESDGKLAIVFPDVQPDFSRKIPVNPNKHLTDIQIQHRQQHLAVIFTFDDADPRFDSFLLADPPRLVIDVFQAAARSTPQTMTRSLNRAEPAAPEAAAKTTKSSRTLARLPFPDPLGSSLTAMSESNKQAPPAPSGQTSLIPTAAPAAVPATTMQSNSPVAVEANLQTPPGLQYYLLVALVVLTIAILFLLIIMLFSRHKWTTNGKKRIKMDDLWHRQDQHIASINSQIEEQLKRYSEI